MLNLLLELFSRAVWVPLTTEPVFARGFWTALGLVFVTGAITTPLRWGWKRISAFFKPSKLPATTNGPSPFQVLTGCLLPLIILFVVVLNVFWFGFVRP